jgi:hypothetical protein
MDSPDKQWWQNARGRWDKAQRRVFFAKWMRRLRPFVLGISVAFAIYVGAFMWQFEMLSNPVGDNQNGWLGPAIRGDTHTVDVVKINYYEGQDFSLYRRYRPLCKVWLWVMGF